jgi:threo-3-hydroxy-L-aspartate ammonia-lyase
VIGLGDVRAAAVRLAGVTHRTPVLTTVTLDDLTGGSVFLKAENFQRTGSFKLRGAYNKMASLASDALAAGVAAFSSGNHAQAVALAARILGTHAVILMPDDAPSAKVDATRSYGAEIVRFDRYTQDRTELGDQMARERSLTLVPPYDDPLIMAGQGTAALELIEECGELDAVVVPVGGGGLIAGCATAAKGLHGRIEIIGVEPAAGDDTKRSLEAGERVRIEIPHTIADGQQLERPGELTFEINRRLVDAVELVTDDEIVDAMRFAFDRLKVVLEPSGATALAALLAGRIAARGRRVGVVLSGGNVGAGRFCSLLKPV